MILILPLCILLNVQSLLAFTTPGHSNRFLSALYSKVDPIRCDKRASLHPTTINAISQALFQRSQKKFLHKSPLELANAAGEIAILAIEKRVKAIFADNGIDIDSLSDDVSELYEDDDMLMTNEECTTLTGRVVGVVMRFDELETMLFEKVSKVEWVSKYNEFESFGVIKGDQSQVWEKIQNDPLFRMNRAECLYALFLIYVERPSLEKSKVDVPGGSDVNFIEQEKLDVLMEKGFY